MDSAVLIIGYGNTLRGDDGAGQLVAQKIADFGWQNVRSLALHQLTPELAAEIASVGRVIFVDAFVTSDLKISVQPLQPANTSNRLGHTGDPQSLLYFTRTIYDYLPPAWWVLIPGVNFEFGEQISEVTERAITEAIAAIEQIVFSESKCTKSA